MKTILLQYGPHFLRGGEQLLDDDDDELELDLEHLDFLCLCPCLSDLECDRPDLELEWDVLADLEPDLDVRDDLELDFDVRDDLEPVLDFDLAARSAALACFLAICA